jgi:hypothetical protein
MSSLRIFVYTFWAQIPEVIIIILRRKKLSRILRSGLHSTFLVASLIYDNPSDIDVAFSKWESPIVVKAQKMQPLKEKKAAAIYFR